MQLIAQEDIEAPIAFVFQQVTDFAAFERQTVRRGADVRRVDTLPQAGLGNIWEVRFLFRGKERDVRAEVTAFDAPDGFTLTATSRNLSAQTVVELVALSRTRTGLGLRLDLSAQSLAARLLLQSLKLARGNINRQFEKRVNDFAKETQGRYERRPGKR